MLKIGDLSEERKEEDKMERELTFEYLKKSLSGDLVEPKKKVKSKDLEGQISIF